MPWSELFYHSSDFSAKTRLGTGSKGSVLQVIDAIWAKLTVSVSQFVQRFSVRVHTGSVRSSVPRFGQWYAFDSRIVSRSLDLNAPNGIWTNVYRLLPLLLRMSIMVQVLQASCGLEQVALGGNRHWSVYLSPIFSFRFASYDQENGPDVR